MTRRTSALPSPRSPPGAERSALLGATARSAVAAQGERVLLLPGRAARRAQLARAVGAHVEAAPLAPRSGEPTQLAVLVHRLADPVDARVAANSLVHRVDQDALVVLVHGVLRHPVRVEQAQTAAGAAHTLLSLAAQVAAPLVRVDAAVARLAPVDALGQLLLAAATADAHAVDAKALLGLVAQVARLLGARRARGTVDDRKLAVLPAAHAEQEADGVRLLLAPDLLEVLEGAHGTRLLEHVRVL
mmetsp:Transcript_7821/g.18726  ORF Transcript_7821/g.18726 Transcript_7821/m.18726 type:complete len:245 (+) Transcript_7821:62-796(+)